jgi:hypothetical protein
LDFNSAEFSLRGLFEKSPLKLPEKLFGKWERLRIKLAFRAPRPSED